MSKRKDTVPSPRADSDPGPDTERPQSLEATGENAATSDGVPLDPESTLDLRGDELAAMMAGRDDMAAEAEAAIDEADIEGVDHGAEIEETEARSETLSDGETAASAVSRAHLMGLLEALIFVSDKPIKSAELAKAASATLKETRTLLAELKADFASRGVQLDEVAGGWIFRTNPQYAPFVRDLTKQKPVKLTRAQVETLAILAYRQPITRPEMDDIRGVDCGAVLKLLLERDLVKILGKKDEPGRPLLYGTTGHFLEFFGLKSLKDLPTLREFTELNEDSRRVVERELGDVLDERQAAEEAAAGAARHSETTERRIALPPEAFEDPESPTGVGGDDSPADAPTIDGEPPGRAPSSEEDATTPPVRVPGAWERAADGDEDEDDDEDEDEDEEDDDDDDDDDEKDDVEEPKEKK